MGKPRNEVLGDVLAKKHSGRAELTLESLDLRKDYLKPESVEQTINIQIEHEEGQVTKVGSLLNPDGAILEEER